MKVVQMAISLEIAVKSYHRMLSESLLPLDYLLVLESKKKLMIKAITHNLK